MNSIVIFSEAKNFVKYSQPTKNHDETTNLL